jgi:hypothetical protein
MTLFLERQIAHTVACQIKAKPRLTFFDPAAPIKQSKREEELDGMTITKPSQWKIAFQTPSTKLQQRKRCSTSSSLPWQ